MEARNIETTAAERARLSAAAAMLTAAADLVRSAASRLGDWDPLAEGDAEQAARMLADMATAARGAALAAEAVTQ